MTTENTQSKMAKFNRLEELRNSLNTNKPDLDQMMPIYDETNAIEEELSQHFKNLKAAIAEKQQKITSYL